MPSLDPTFIPSVAPKHISLRGSHLLPPPALLWVPPFPTLWIQPSVLLAPLLCPNPRSDGLSFSPSATPFLISGSLCVSLCGPYIYSHHRFVFSPTTSPTFAPTSSLLCLASTAPTARLHLLRYLPEKGFLSTEQHTTNDVAVLPFPSLVLCSAPLLYPSK
jgi:hypothetical protein